MKEITNTTELAEMLMDDQPISKDGLLLQDWYANLLKNNSLSNKSFVELSIQVIPESLKLFPKYPHFVRFVQWVQQAGLDTHEFYDSLFIFLNEEWTEEKYPRRNFERLFVIEHILGKTKHLSSFEWIEKTSPQALVKDLWKKSDIKYFFANDKKEKEIALLEMTNSSLISMSSFFSNLTLRIPRYLEDFSKDEILSIFNSCKTKLDSETWEKIEKWITIFSREK